MSTLIQGITENWTVWLVSVVLIVAAVIDGKILKVPNKLTFPFIISGWLYCSLAGGMGWDGWQGGLAGAATGLGSSLLGTFVGMMLLLVLRNVGGMGAGDVKLLAGVGAWLGAMVTLQAFAATAITGGIMAAWMIYRSGRWEKHVAMAMQILNEWSTIKQPSKLAAIARERKPTMSLLPYGIPMAIGSIIYFAAFGMLISF